MVLSLQSPAFKHGGQIPSQYTCDGEDISPPLEWKNIPENTQSLVLIVDDPDAPDPRAPQRTWVHWVVYNIPPELSGLPEGAASGALPVEAKEGLNDWKKCTYGGACPPIGRHRYFHKLYALDCKLDKLNKPDKATLESKMRGHVLAQAELVGTYEKLDK